MDADAVGTAGLDIESCYRAVKSRDRRFDGVFYTAVSTTGIYCRPSCPARTPAYANVTFHRSAAAAQAAGYRACKRCLPDATPGSPDWDVAATAAGRAMRLIADGVVDREGVDGLARRVGYTSRHLSRILAAELGAGPLALARARRAQTARVLIETTSLTYAEIAFAAGFSSVRQFNDTVREVYAATPTELRGRRGGGRASTGSVTMRLAVRTPFAGRALLDFLAHHLVPGVEVAGPGWYARTLDLPHGPGTVRLALGDEPQEGQTALVTASYELTDLRDTAAAVERTRRLLDADCDPLAIAAHFAGDPVIGPLARRHPGLRVPGQVDGDEVAIRTVIGQQVSVAGACTVTGRLVAAHGRPVASAVPGLTHLFPDAATLAEVDPASLPMPRSRGRALVALAGALAAGAVALDRGPDRAAVREALLSLPGIGPWTADYVAMRALADPDVFLPTDVGVRNALTGLGHDPVTVVGRAAEWRPWRSYALMHLWNTLMPPTAATVQTVPTVWAGTEEA
ncbi:AlkA N-terminal domain-containing protein [Nocardioides panaciterrulae]|uniref:DNA-3-methyladenine glycosylase II n=1 Tax=Nocardioides panaciterrulae TaxID=661492 RepID=A0A7Y9E7L3_9ACTN|nr:AlkA N-terminal domain-containing protein [Nocardioides panaciterrulae]NYD42467.1 AraC family transcriptional regulator of adaptative response / DNA-3-methyladenine glycosylase II [Nocardioides panaciterrulae]